jgi:hypothetical protein
MLFERKIDDYYLFFDHNIDDRTRNDIISIVTYMENLTPEKIRSEFNESFDIKIKNTHGYNNVIFSKKSNLILG